MRLLFFTSLKAVHSRKWLTHLAPDFDIHMVTFRATAEDLIKGITVHELQKGSEQPQPVSNIRQDTASSESKAWETFKIGLRYGRKFAEMIDELRPDIIHAHQSVPFGWYAARAHTLCVSKPPLVISTWGTDVNQYPEQSWLYRVINRYTLKRANRITATSQTLKRSTQRWAPHKKVETIHFGIDTNHFSRKNSAPKHALVFGMPKILRRVRGLDIYGLETAIKALSITKQKNKDIRLEIAGDGPERGPLEQLVKELDLNNQVTFLGFVPHNQMPSCMQSWDALLLPSKQESFGVVALEAQACGLPVLASKVGGIPEVVTAKTARFVEPTTAHNLAQAMLTLSNDTTFLNSAYDHGPKFVSDNYSWSQSVEAMKNLYSSLAI